MIGSTIQNRYRIEAELGRGGMGVVFRGHDTLLDRDIAIKVLSDPKLSAEGRARLLREARAAAQLNHPNIVSVYDAGESDGTPFIVMELVEGMSLHERPTQSLGETFAVARQVCAALNHAHVRGIIHRDIKPENILIARDGTVKLMDFGLAHFGPSRLTQEGALIGTVFYLAPEQVLGEEVDARTDLYALGVLLYELTTGRLPFSGDDPLAVISQHLHAAVVPPREHNPTIPIAFNDLIVQMMSKRPSDRPASAAQVQQLMENRDVENVAPDSASEHISSLLDRITRSELTGRKRELEELTGMWQRTLSGDGQVVLIEGEAGMGKTRLVGELGTHVMSDRAFILLGECYAEGGTPFAPFAEIVREFLGNPGAVKAKAWLERLGATAVDLFDLVPEYKPFFPDLPPLPALAPNLQRRRLYEAFTLWLEGLATERPLLLIVEDLHWADDSSLDLLLHLARRLASRRVLIVTTCRADEKNLTLTKALAALERAKLIHQLQLAPLDSPAVAMFVRRVLDLSANPPRDFLDALYARTEGNPFFIEELLRAVKESGALTGWSQTTLEVIGVPRSIRESIGLQMDQMSEPAQAVAMRAAVIGRRFDFDFLSAIVGMGEDALLAALQPLVQAQIVIEQVSGTNVIMSFRHSLMHEVIYNRMLAAERRKWHSIVGAELERRTGFDEARLEATRASLPHHLWAQYKSLDVPAEVDQLARHFVLGGEWQKAFRFALLAAERNSAIFAERTALRWTNQALQLVAEKRVNPSPGLLLDVYITRCAAQWLVGEYNAGVADAETALPLARKHGDWQREVGVLHWLSHIHLDQGLYEESIQRAQEALAIVEAHNDQAGIAHMLLNLGEACISGVRGKRDEGLAYLEKARPLCEAIGDRMGVAHIELEEGHLKLLRGEYEAAKAHFERAIPISRKLLDASGLTRSLNYLGLALRDMGNYDASLSTLHDAWRSAEALDVDAQAGFAMSNISTVYFLQGSYSEALAIAERAVDLLRTINANSLLPYALAVLGDAQRELGNTERALESYERALPIAREVQDPCWESFALAGRGLTRLERDLEGALNDLQSAFSVCRRSQDVYSRYTVLSLVKLASGYLAAAQPDAAARLSEEAIKMCEAPRLRDLASESHRLLGLALAQREQWQAAETELQLALTVARELTSPTLEWRAHQALGEIYSKQGKQSAAQNAFASAAAIVAQLSQQVSSETEREAFLSRPEVKATLEQSAGKT